MKIPAHTAYYYEAVRLRETWAVQKVMPGYATRIVASGLSQEMAEDAARTMTPLRFLGRGVG